MYTHACVCVCVCVYVCVRVCVLSSIECVLLYRMCSENTHTHTHTNAHFHPHTHTPTRTHPRTADMSPEMKVAVGSKAYVDACFAMGIHMCICVPLYFLYYPRTQQPKPSIVYVLVSIVYVLVSRVHVLVSIVYAHKISNLNPKH